MIKSSTNMRMKGARVDVQGGNIMARRRRGSATGSERCNAERGWPRRSRVGRAYKYLFGTWRVGGWQGKRTVGGLTLHCVNARYDFKISNYQW